MLVFAPLSAATCQNSIRANSHGKSSRSVGPLGDPPRATRDSARLRCPYLASGSALEKLSSVKESLQASEPRPEPFAVSTVCAATRMALLG